MNEKPHKAEEIKGKAKTAAGKATGDQSLEAEGKTDVAEAEGKQAADNVKNTVRGVADSLRNDPKH
ncbi:CsbD family protein [Brevibacterium limosum]|uniref:CsbD family protein n=1 Tax=Brevibacterium limosum TaxID=2697565 RepID=UPI001422D84D|nr:CsbD family protein [Brevibacterium limosum]